MDEYKLPLYRFRLSLMASQQHTDLYAAIAIILRL
jgi:hypothetical protein